MQLKFNKQTSIGQTWLNRLIKLIALLLVLMIGIFLLEKINFPSPKNNIKKDITNEVTKLK
tara:strand:+ start:384 stop:566 length:183 start_codon:yes stop_codon:yes gene_type:complete